MITDLLLLLLLLLNVATSNPTDQFSLISEARGSVISINEHDSYGSSAGGLLMQDVGLSIPPSIQQQPELPDCEPYYIAGVYTAVCMRRRLTQVPQNLMTSIQVLDASSNHISVLRDGDFKAYPWLLELYLEQNQLRYISPGAFANLSRLHTLVLSNNQLDDIDAEVFRPLISLKILRLSNNPLRVIRRDMFKHLRGLVELRLDACLLTKLEPGAMRSLAASLEVFSIAFNSLSILHADVFLATTNRLLTTSAASTGQSVIQAGIASHSSGKRELHLYGNPWHCGCELRWLRQLIADQPDVNFAFGPTESGQPVCTSPPRLAGQSWLKVPSEKFACEPVVTSANMPTAQTVGSNVTLQCFFAADPQPTFRWLKDGRSISVTDFIPPPTTPLSTKQAPSQLRIGEQSVEQVPQGIPRYRQRDRKMAAHNFSTRLDLVSATLEFSGTYECVAENTAGVSKSKFHVKIRPAGIGNSIVIGARTGSGLSSNVEPSPTSAVIGVESLLGGNGPFASLSQTTRLVIAGVVISTAALGFLLLLALVYACCCRTGGFGSNNCSRTRPGSLLAGTSTGSPVPGQNGCGTNGVALSAKGSDDNRNSALSNSAMAILRKIEAKRQCLNGNGTGGFHLVAGAGTLASAQTLSASALATAAANGTLGLAHSANLGPSCRQLNEKVQMPISPMVLLATGTAEMHPVSGETCCIVGATIQSASSATTSPIEGSSSEEADSTHMDTQPKSSPDSALPGDSSNSGSGGGIAEDTMAPTANRAKRIYSDFLSITLPKLVSSPRSRTSTIQRPLLQQQDHQLLVRNKPNSLSIHPAPRACLSDFSDLELTDVEVAAVAVHQQENHRLLSEAEIETSSNGPSPAPQQSRPARWVALNGNSNPPKQYSNHHRSRQSRSPVADGRQSAGASSSSSSSDKVSQFALLPATDTSV